MKEKNLIQLASMERILKQAGAERISQNSKEALRDCLQEKGLEVSEKAIKLAKHAGRKTVLASDIKLSNR